MKDYILRKTKNYMRLDHAQKRLYERIVFDMVSGRYLVITDAGYKTTGNKDAIIREGVAILHELAPDMEKKKLKSIMVKFVAEDMLNISGTTMVPSGTPVVRDITGAIYLNTWVDKRPSPKGDVSKALLMLRLVHENICGSDPLPEDELDKLYTPEECSIEYRYLMQIIANSYLNPGNPPITAPMIVAYKGAGKDTLAAMLKSIVGGGDYSGQANKKDILNGFTKSLHNKLVIHWNEAQGMRDTQMLNILEQFISSESFSVRVKGSDGFDTPCIAQHFFWTPDLPNWRVDERERRLFVIEGAKTENCRELSRQLHAECYNGYTPKSEVVHAFCKVLRDVKIDRDFINNPPSTKLKEQLIYTSDTVLQWLDHVDITGEHTTAELLTVYNAWLKVNYPHNAAMNVKAFGLQLAKAQKRSSLKFEKIGHTRRGTVYEFEDSVVARQEDAQVLSMLSKLKKRI
jgi:hypothetical protein